MRITDYRRKWITQEFNKYAKQIGIPPDLMPDLMLTTKEVLEMPIELTEGRRSSAHSYYGVCYREACTIFINMRKLKSFSRIRETIVHELVHYRFPYMPWNNKALKKRIELILKGKDYPLMTKLERMSDSFVPYDRDNRYEWHIAVTKKQIEDKTREDKREMIRHSAEWLEKHNVRTSWILQELIGKYGKHINKEEIETGFNLFQLQRERKEEEGC